VHSVQYLVSFTTRVHVYCIAMCCRSVQVTVAPYVNRVTRAASPPRVAALLPLTMAVASSEAFFADVRRFFALLDLDHNQQVDYGEATMGMHQCFDAVHRVRSPSSSASASSPSPSQHQPPPDAPPVSAAHKQQVVANQVNWLFSATQHIAPTPGSSLPAPLLLSDFEQCYHRLLQSAYEQEVLHLDLKRAIDSLSSSPHWAAMSDILSRARRVFTLRMTGREDREEVMNRCFQSLTSGTEAGFASSKKAAVVRSIVDRLRAGGGRNVSEEEWMRGLQEMVGVEFNYAALIRDLDSVLAEAATGGATAQ
jgi:hypothetical protein